MNYDELKPIIETLLLSANQPLNLDKLQEIFSEWHAVDKPQLRAAITQLQADYLSRSFELIEVAGGYIIQTKKEYNIWVSRMQVEKPAKYSRALLETLAIIAYKQPVTRGDIEELRGVAVNSAIIKTLVEREWIRITGYKDVPGKPAVYSTTKEFLNYFNLKSLNELPPLPQTTEVLNLNYPNVECIT